MGAGDDERQGPRDQSGQAVAAEAVTEYDRVVNGGVRGVDHGLQLGAHRLGALVVQALREELHVHLVRRAHHGVAELPQDHFTADQEDAHQRTTRARARMKSGLVPQQPPTNEAPASTRAGRNVANVSGDIE